MSLHSLCKGYLYQHGCLSFLTKASQKYFVGQKIQPFGWGCTYTQEPGLEPRNREEERGFWADVARWESSGLRGGSLNMVETPDACRTPGKQKLDLLVARWRTLRIFGQLPSQLHHSLQSWVIISLIHKSHHFRSMHSFTPFKWANWHLKAIVASSVLALPHHCIPRGRLMCTSQVITCEETDCALVQWLSSASGILQ